MMPPFLGREKFLSDVFLQVPELVTMKTNCSSLNSLTGRIALITSSFSRGSKLTIGLPLAVRDAIGNS